MLYSLSHEVRTPLNGMKGILHLMKCKSDTKYYKQIKIALSCCQFLECQINSILDYAQILKNEFSLHLEFVDITCFLAKIQKYALYIIQGKNSSIEIKIDISSNIKGKYIIDKDRIKK